MTHLDVALAAVGLVAASGAAAILLLALDRARAAARVATGGALVACAIGLATSIDALRLGVSAELAVAWRVPSGAFVVGVDPLTAFFLIPLFALGALVAVHASAYFAHEGGRAAVRPLATLDLLLAAMAMVLLARHALLFLFAWESMTLLAYLLVTVDDRQAEARRAGWIYLLASHVAMMALIALFLALGDRAGGALEFVAFAAAGPATPAVTWGLFGLAVLGFGIKSGVIGLHVWLPEAHAAAPAPVSALMSGVLIKLGIYGLLRILGFLPPSSGFGVVLMSLGLAGAIIGIALAVYQRDLKRALAYSSIENVGVVLLGVGLGTWGRARGDHAVAVLGFAGGLLHVWNHAAMKGLLFLGAGNVVHATGTRDIERLGGLAQRMRWTAAAMIAGAVAIAGLPPLNGFVSEWLIYRGLLAAGLQRGWWSLPALGGVALLALVGGLAMLCFVRLIGIVLLGRPRSEAARGAHEATPAMLVPVVALALICPLLALGAGSLVGLAEPLVAALADAAPAAGPAAAAAVGDTLTPLTVGNGALLAAIALVGALGVMAARRTAVARRAAVDDTWGCGYAAPTPRMQYTGRGFAEMLADRLLPRPLRARRQQTPPNGPFPGAAALSTDCDDPLTRGLYEPFLRRWGDRFARLRRLQQYSLHAYLLYVVAAAVLGLGWASVYGWWAP